MRSDVLMSIQQFHRALFTKVLHGGTTCLHGYAMDDNGKWIVCQHCRDKMRGSWPFGPDPSINSVVIWGLSQWCSRQSEAVLPRAGNWATQVANFCWINQKKIAEMKKIEQRKCGKDIQKNIFWGGNRRLVSQGQATGPSRWAWLGRHHPPSSPRLTIDQHVYFPISMTPSIFMYRLLLMLM